MDVSNTRTTFGPRLLAGALWSLTRLLSPRANIAAVSHAIGIFRRHRELIVELLKRDLGSQFEGQTLGSFWIVAHPLFQLCVYIFVFAYVFKLRMGVDTGTVRDYTTYILAGLIPWLTIQQSLLRSSNVLLGQSNLVKQVVFPIEVLPLGSVLVAIVPELIGFVIIGAYTLARFGDLPWTYVLLPVVFVLQLGFMTGLALVVSIVTPFLRDIREIVTILTFVGVYMIPAFYLPDWGSGAAKVLIAANPFSYVIWVFQDVLYFGSFKHPYSWLIFTVMSGLSFALGFRAFRTVKLYVANVL